MESSRDGASGSELPRPDASIDAEVLQVALRIHPQAWWDGENLKKQVGERGHMDEWVRMLRGLPAGFGMRMHDWRQVYWAGTATDQAMREYFAAYTPGNHWLHLVRELPREDVLGMGEAAADWAVTSMAALLPLYRFILWDPA